MQSRPTEISQSFSDRVDTDTPNPTQHGHQHLSSLPDPGSSDNGVEVATGSVEPSTSTSSPSRDASFASSGGPWTDGHRAESDGMSGRRSDRRTPSPVDKIIDHERASPRFASSKEASTGIQVISRSKNAPAPRVSLHELPSEVLTHVCSYLPADSFTAMSLVSRKIHRVVTEQHAWRMAFARYFLGHESLNENVAIRHDRAGEEVMVSEKRYFTRLTALSSWRSEYIIRTRLLRSLSKGSPSDLDQLLARSSRSSKATRLSQVDYNVDMDCPVTCVEGSFELKNNRPHVRLVHGSDEDCRATLSNPLESKHIPWSFQSAFLQFFERFPNVEMYGLGAGEVVGVPNPMDISPLFGLLVGDGTPGGRIYHRHLDEKRGNYLSRSVNDGAPELGIPKIDPVRESMTAVWLSKTRNIPIITDGLIGALVGTSTGTVIACSLGTNGTSTSRVGQADITARWVLSPGVPIIAFGVDENFSARRRKLGRVWVFALNALGEVFFLKDFPETATEMMTARQPSDWDINANAWKTGRTAYWGLIEPTRRKAKPNPFEDSEIDGSYSPRSSANSHGLSAGQLAAETKEIEVFLYKPPIHFRNVCQGWDMQRRLECDFSGDDEHGAGESVFVINCGLNEGHTPSIQRYTRLLIEDVVRVAEPESPARSPSPPIRSVSLFGNPNQEPPPSVWNVTRPENVRRLSRTSSEGAIPEERFEVWKQSNFTFGGLRTVQITASARDKSTYSEFTTDEDPLLSLNPISTTWSPTASPIGRSSKFGHSADIPGQRARMFSVGTRIGTVIVWNMRAPLSSSTELVNDIEPVSITHTESPGISSLAMTALYLVHGGNDGLVQAWDFLGSTKDPVRTLHSKFTQRARRDLRQNQNRPQGVGMNFYAAGAICLDPDPKVLRGVVGIGNRLRYWSYSSIAADSYRGSKRRSQRDRRSSNQGSADPKVTRTGRGALADYIANEQADLERAKRAQQRETSRFNARFGANLLGEGATDDEIMAYATMISEESYASDNARRLSLTSSSASSIAGSPGMGLTYPPSVPEEPESQDRELAKALENDDKQLAEALRRSLRETSAEGSPEPEPESELEPEDLGFTVKFAKDRKGRRSPKGKKTSASTGSVGTPGNDSGNSISSMAEADDLDYALQLSMAEEASRKELEEQFPLVKKSPSSPVGSSASGKGKRRAQY